MMKKCLHLAVELPIEGHLGGNWVEAVLYHSTYDRFSANAEHQSIVVHHKNIGQLNAYMQDISSQNPFDC